MLAGWCWAVRDRERRPVSANGNGNGLSRLNAQETRQLLDADRAPLATVVDADGRVVDEPVLLPVSARAALTPAPAKLPVKGSAAIGEIRAEGAATAAGIAHGYVVERTEAKAAHAGAVGELAVCRGHRAAAEEQLAKVGEEWATLLAGLPRRVRRRLGQRVSRVAKLTPWAMWGADTLLIANAYGVFGAVAMPFPQSTYLSNAVMLLRAGLVSFGLVFGLRMVGGRLRDVAEEVRERTALVGRAADTLVAGVVIGAAVMLAVSAAALQQAFLQLTMGGTQVAVPTSVLLSIVVFLGAVSLAAGYFSAEPELARLAGLDELIATARAQVANTGERVARQLGVVRALRASLAAIDEREQHELVEHAEHTNRRVYAHIGGNPDVYGLELDTDATRVPGGKL